MSAFVNRSFWHHETGTSTDVGKREINVASLAALGEKKILL